MLSDPFPGWLLKRAHEVRARRIVTILAPTNDTSPCAYLLDLLNNRVEFHVAEDGVAGVEAATVVFSRKEAATFIARFIAALSGRDPGIVVHDDREEARGLLRVDQIQ